MEDFSRELPDLGGSAVRALPSDLTEREEIDLLCQVETYMNVTDKHSQTHPAAGAEEARIYSLVNSLIAKRFSDIGAAVRGEAIAESSAMRFRKKPVEIEAIQWTGNLDCLDAFNIPELHQSFGSKNVGIPTLEGTMIAHVGDWIIKGVKGEFYPCKPDIFEITYVSTRAADAPSEPSEQVSRLFAWLVRASQCGIKPIEQAAEVMKDYYQGVGPEPEYDQFRAADALDSQRTDGGHAAANCNPAICKICEKDYPDIVAEARNPTDGGVRK